MKVYIKRKKNITDTFIVFTSKNNNAHTRDITILRAQSHTLILFVLIKKNQN